MFLTLSAVRALADYVGGERYFCTTSGFSAGMMSFLSSWRTRACTWLAVYCTTAMVADLETAIGVVEVVPGSVGITAAVTLFDVANLAPEIVRNRWLSTEVQAGTLIALELNFF